MIAAVCNRKLYSLVLSCMYLCKIPAEKTFLCFADKIGFVFALLVFYLFRYLFVRAFPVQVKPVWAKPAQEKPFLGKSLKCGEFGAVLPRRCDANAPNRGVSRGDRGGVWGCCGVGFAYNFLLESKTYILIFWAFPL